MMNKKELEAYFKTYVMPAVVDRYEQDGIPDKPARREAWNDTVDALIKDKMLPERAGNWTHPAWLETIRIAPRLSPNPAPLGISWARWGVAALFVGVGVFGFAMGRRESRLVFQAYPAK